MAIKRFTHELVFDDDLTPDELYEFAEEMRDTYNNLTGAVVQIKPYSGDEDLNAVVVTWID